MPDDSGPGNAIGGGFGEDPFGGNPAESSPFAGMSEAALTAASDADVEAAQAETAALVAKYGKTGAKAGVILGLLSGNPLVAAILGVAGYYGGQAMAGGFGGEINGSGMTSGGGPAAIGGVPFSTVPAALPPAPTGDMVGAPVMGRTFGGTQSLNDLLGTYTSEIGAAGDKYRSSLADIQVQWQNFVATHEAAKNSILDDMEETYAAIGPEYDKIRGQYDTDIAGIPKASVRAPIGMGGDLFDLAPVRHTQVYGDQAADRTGISDSKFDQLRQMLTGRSTALEAGSRPTLNALQNLMTNAGNIYISKAGESEAAFQAPWDLAKLKLQLEGNKDVANINQGPKPNFWDRIAPAVAYGVSNYDWSA